MKLYVVLIDNAPNVTNQYKALLVELAEGL